MANAEKKNYLLKNVKRFNFVHVTPRPSLLVPRFQRRCVFPGRQRSNGSSRCLVILTPGHNSTSLTTDCRWAVAV
ncbi:hypothetical protein T10_2239 [Trichinella papuae]|uniref:Uncharacterized protein n=1 Tax=Trichinella papuae TaxID=268474 RepID=A0A0V1N863_9BILA|nr:hypothetical protein T10_2239 [Trichinella papuae]